MTAMYEARARSLFGMKRGDKIYALYRSLHPSLRDAWIENLFSFSTTTDRDVQNLVKWRIQPVSIREFFESPFYLDKKNEIFPPVMDALIEINSGKYDEVVLTGGIGSAKTSTALYSQSWQLYLLSCYRDPHRLMGIDKSSEIKVIMQSLNAKLARGVDYNRLRALIEESPYFQRHFPFNKDLESKMEFPHRIEVEPVSGVESGTIGQNVIGGNIDEVNFMSVVEKSKMGEGGGAYDQAWALYTSIARRRKTRFAKAGAPLPGLLCLISSRKTPGQFTDIKEEEARTNKRIYIYDKRVWDIKPPGTYCGEKFRVFIGDEFRKPRILEAGEKMPEKDAPLIDEVPIEFIDDYKTNLLNALRDFSGKSTMAIHPYMTEQEKIVKAFGKRLSILSEEKHDLRQLPKLSVIKSRFTNLDCMRWAHIDLGVTGCSAGVTIGHVPRFQEVTRSGILERLPVIALDCTLEVPPPLNGEIDFAAIRRVLIKLRDMGLPIKWVSADSFQSVDTLQILRQMGFITGTVSTVTSPLMFDITKQAFYDERVESPKHAKLQSEFVKLERNTKDGKIDHPPGGTKDCADSAASVIGSLSIRREIWSHHKVPIIQAVSLSGLIQDSKDSKGKKSA